MAYRDGHPHGTPGWVDLSTDNVEVSKTFYAELFGWRWEDQQAPGQPYTYSIAHLDDRTVAGLGSAPADMVEAGITAVWNTYLIVDSVDEAHQAAVESGGTTLFGPLDVMEAGRMAYLMDDQGACVGLWQAGRHKGAQVVKEPGAFTWAELLTVETDRAVRFYGAVAALESTTTVMECEGNTMTYHLWMAGDECAGGLMARQDEAFPPHWHVYFVVDDAAQAASKVGDLGGKVQYGPFPTPMGIQAVIEDPRGAMFSILQANEWAA